MSTGIIWKADWSDDEHPRDEHGRFAGGGFTSSEWEQPAPDTRVNYDERGNRYELKGDPGLLDNANLRFGGNDQLSVEVTNKDGERIAQVTALYDYGDLNVSGPVIKIWKYEVDESLRGQGLARRMVEAMHDNVTMLGDKAMVLHAGFVSTEGQHFAETMNPEWNRVMGSDESKWRKPNAYVKKQVIYKADWEEGAHPRGANGRFGEGGGADHEPQAFQTLPGSQTTKALKEAAAWTGNNCTGFVPSMVEAPILPASVDGVSKGVTDDQAEALEHYSDDGYKGMNRDLRGERETVDSNIVMRDVQAAIDANTINENAVVFRGTTDANLTVQILSMAPGETFTDKGFVSTSLVRGVGEQFSSQRGMVFQMAVPEGSHAVGLVGGEGELLLGANSKFRLESVDTSGKIPVAKITYVGADPHMTGTFKKAKRGDVKDGGKFGWTADCITIQRKPSKAKKSTQIIWKSVGFGHETIVWKEWNPDDHPRGEGGRFGSGGSEPGSAPEGEVTPNADKAANSHGEVRKAIEGDLTNSQGANSVTAAMECKATIAKDIADRMGDKFDDQLIGEFFTMQPEETKHNLMYELRDGQVQMLNLYEPNSRKWNELGMQEDENGRSTGVELVRGDDPRVAATLREEGISKLIGRWAETSNDTSVPSLAMQEAAKREFGITSSASWDYRVSALEAYDQPANATDEQLRQAGIDPADITDMAETLGRDVAAVVDSKEGEMNQAFLRAQYDSTQAFFKERGITELPLYRGMTFDTGLPDWAADAEGEKFGTEDYVPLRPLSSFSYEESEANNFAGNRQGSGDATSESKNTSPGVIVSGAVPVDRILSCARTGLGCLSEREVVVIAGDGEWKIKDANPNSRY